MAANQINYAGMAGSLTSSKEHTIRLLDRLEDCIYVTPAVKDQTQDLTFSENFSLEVTGTSLSGLSLSRTSLEIVFANQFECLQCVCTKQKQ